MRRVVTFAKVIASIFLVQFLITLEVKAELIRLKWNTLSNQNQVSRYLIRLGTVSNNYTKIFLTQSNFIQIDNITPNIPVYYRIFALNNNNQILDQSAEISFQLPITNSIITLDSDNDGVSNGLDNCISTSNSSQLDSDLDGTGDACDIDPNNANFSPIPSPTVVASNSPSSSPTMSATSIPTTSSTPQTTPSQIPPSTSIPPQLATPIPTATSSQTPRPSPTVIPNLPSEPNNNLIDSDNDGVSDADEITNGTDPLDRGSKIETLKNSFCNEWNGVFGMYNFAELRNKLNKNIYLTAVMYNSAALELSRTPLMIEAGAQRDVALHELSGFEVNTFGRVCFLHSEANGSLDGGVTYYLPNRNSNGYQFAYSSSFTNGQKGEVFLPLNTYNPNLSYDKQNNMVANWIQITSLNDKAESGTIYFHDQGGAIIGSTQVTFGIGQRRDISGHNFGKMIGMARWVPQDSSSTFLVRVVRYIYDNANQDNSFDTAFQINGLYGTGALQTVPLDLTQGSSIIEVLNTSNQATSARVEIRTESGVLKSEIFLGQNQLPAYGSFHIIVDEILEQGERGVAFIRGATPNSIAVVSMVYARNEFGNINYMYGVNAVTTVKSTGIGTFNSYLSQIPTLIIPNTSASDINVEITLNGRQGQLNRFTQSIPARGSVNLNLRALVPSDSYGTISINSPIKLASWVVREKGLEYGIPTQVN